jgi:hypothetical protein
MDDRLCVVLGTHKKYVAARRAPETGAPRVTLLKAINTIWSLQLLDVMPRGGKRLLVDVFNLFKKYSIFESKHTSFFLLQHAENGNVLRHRPRQAVVAANPVTNSCLEATYILCFLLLK